MSKCIQDVDRRDKLHSIIGSRFLLRSVSRLSSSLAGNEFGTIDFLQVFFDFVLCVPYVPSTSRHSDTTDTTTRKQFLLPSRGTRVISSKSPRLITSRTARNGAKFFDRSIPGSISPGITPKQFLMDTLYPKRTNFVFLACPKHKRSIDIHTYLSKIATSIKFNGL